MTCKCVCVLLLLADILIAALLRGRSKRDRRRGGDLYFWSSYSHGVPQGRAALGSPPRMAVLGRNLQEVSSRGHHLQVTKHIPVLMSYFMLDIDLQIKSQSSRWLQSQSTLFYLLLKVWVLTALLQSIKGLNVAKKKQKKKKPARVSNIQAFSVAVTTTRTRGGNLGQPDSFVLIQRRLPLKGCQLAELTHTLQQLRLRQTDLKCLWSNRLIEEPQFDYEWAQAETTQTSGAVNGMQVSHWL